MPITLFKDDLYQLRAGAALSNTAPATCTVLRAGIDSLYLSFPGLLSEEGVARLDKARGAARSDVESDQALAQVSILDHLFSAGPTGGKHFKYLLQDYAYRIQLKSKASKHLPLALCKISSDFLTAVGVEQAVSQLRLILAHFGAADSIANVSRLDLFADFVSPYPPEWFEVSAWVTRAKRKSKFWMGETHSGWSIGEGGLMARLYNKSLEVKKSGKTYLLPMWKEKGWDGTSPVYRLEFQYRNEVLRELSSSKYPAVLDRLGGLWTYAMASWLRLTVPNPEDQTKSRWAIHPLWSALRDTAWINPGELSRVPVLLSRAPGADRLYGAFFSSLTSFMGAKGITDPGEAAKRLFEEAWAFYEEKGDFKGEGFYGQATTRAARKAMTYNLPFPGVTQEAERLQLQAVADAYRKASGR